MATSLLLLLLPFIQLGASYYGSVATLMALLCVAVWRQPLLFSVLNWRTHVRVIVMLGMFLSLASAASSQSLLDVLRIAREGIIFLLMTTLIEWFSRNRGGSVEPVVLRTAFALTFAFLVIAIAQTFALRDKIYLGIPKPYFAQNDNTLPEALDLLYSTLRPTGTFGEPSYFAFILISLFVMFLPLAHRFKPVRLMLVGLTAAGVLSQSLTFALALPFIVYFGYVRTATAAEKIRLAGLAAVLLAAFFIIGHATVAARLEAGLFGRGDTSTYVRFVAPLSIMGDFLLRHPLGVTFSTLPSVLQPFASKWGLLGIDILMNGILNALFCYGVFGAAVIGAYLLSARDATLRIYLFVCACMNGALFSIDKFVVISLTMSLYMLSTATAKEAAQQKQKAKVSRAPLAAFPALKKFQQRQRPV